MDANPRHRRLHAACVLVRALISRVRLWRAFAVLTLGFSLAGAAAAQETGNIVGRVLDNSTGKYLEGAELSVAGVRENARSRE